MLVKWIFTFYLNLWNETKNTNLIQVLLESVSLRSGIQSLWKKKKKNGWEEETLYYIKYNINFLYKNMLDILTLLFFLNVF